MDQNWFLQAGDRKDGGPYYYCVTVWATNDSSWFYIIPASLLQPCFHLPQQVHQDLSHHVTGYKFSVYFNFLVFTCLLCSNFRSPVRHSSPPTRAHVLSSALDTPSNWCSSRRVPTWEWEFLLLCVCNFYSCQLNKRAVRSREASRSKKALRSCRQSADVFL